MPANRKVTDSDIETIGRTYMKFGRQMTFACLKTVQHEIGWPVSKPIALKWARYWVSKQIAYQEDEIAPPRPVLGKVEESEESNLDNVEAELLEDLTGLSLVERLERARDYWLERLADGDPVAAGALDKIMDQLRKEREVSGTVEGPAKGYEGWDPDTWNFPEGFTLKRLLSGEYPVELALEYIDLSMAKLQDYKRRLLAIRQQLHRVNGTEE